MKNVDIFGIGILSSLGSAPREVWGSLTENKPANNERKISFSSFLPPAKKRRTDRFSDMSVYTAVTALQDAETVATEKTGTVYTTGYGPLTGNLAFARKVALGDPDLCSPTAFSGTVSNACVGQICMNLGCKGPSTVLTSSNNIGYTQMLLSSGKANDVLTGATEEYNEELFSALSKQYPLSVEYAEGAVSFLIGASGLLPEKYCTVVDFAECYVGGYPPFGDVDSDLAKKNIEQALLSVPEFKEAEAVLPSDAGIPFDETEKEILFSALGQKKMISGVKKRLGETLGCAYNMNVAIAAMILKNGRIPSALGGGTASSVLVTGYDLSGSYYMTLLKK